MDGLKIGHYSDQENGTGVSVFLLEKGALGAFLMCGQAPASHELAVLEPENSVPKLHALVFTGGSAYGLNVASGVMTYLSERNIGHPTIAGVVPIVPTAAIYDLAYKNPVPPLPEHAYHACEIAKENNKEQGAIGAGTGATIGKLMPTAKRMRGGLGFAEMHLADGVHVLSYAVANCVGDVYDQKGRIIAGACDETFQFVNCEKYLLSNPQEPLLFTQSNSTLVAVFTNALFSKAELKRIAKAAIAGMARAVAPVFTRFDGDILFCVSVGDKKASELIIGTIAAETVRLAIIDAVRNTGIIS